MKVFKFCLLPLLAFLALATLGVWLWGRSQPTEWSVERSHVIAATPAEIHPHLADLRAWEAWMTWKRKDPTMTVTYTGDPGVGMTSNWNGKDGEGSQTILESDPAVGIRTRTTFPEFTPFESTIHYAPAGDGATRVTWRTEGTANNWGEQVFGALADAFLGADFEQNLQYLDEVVTGVNAGAPAEK